MQHFLKILCLTVLLGMPSLSWGQLSHVGAIGTNGNGAVSVTTATLDTTGSDLLVCSISCSSGGSFDTTPVSDSKGNTWIQATFHGTTAAQWYAKNATVGTGHTFTLTLTGAGFPTIGCSAVSGSNTSAPLDQVADNDDGGPVTTHNSPSISTTQADEILFGTYVDNVLAEGIAVAGSYIGAYVVDTSTTNSALGHEYQIVSATGSYTSQFTTTSAAWGGNLIASYKAASGGPVVNVFRRRVQ